MELALQVDPAECLLVRGTKECMLSACILTQQADDLQGQMNFGAL